jgi:hypothetical protein
MQHIMGWIDIAFALVLGLALAILPRLSPRIRFFGICLTGLAAVYLVGALFIG